MPDITLFGKDDSLPQVVNLSDPVKENFFFGIPDDSARASFNQIGIYLGFTYFFAKTLTTNLIIEWGVRFVIGPKEE